MIPLRTTVQSFDLFDTLVARACVTPANLFAEVGSACNRPGFAAARMAAEQRVFARGGDFDLADIYRELAHCGFCDEAGARRLMTAEIDAEFDNAIPIAENLALVKDFDLVISDMYLPAATLRGLLQHVGLRCFVHLFVSNAGKFHGTVWPRLTEHWLILRHLGDQEHADVTQPRRFGIAATGYTGAARSEIEEKLENAGLPGLARIARQLRLANPYPRVSVEAGLWDHFVQFNLPLLCLTAAEARRQRDAAGKEKLLFLARDCHFLSEIFALLYPGETAELVYVSRAALAEEPERFADYLTAHGLAEALLCDLVSTGYSWLNFSQTTGVSVAFYALIHIDNYQYEPFDLAELTRHDHYRFRSGVRGSEVSARSMAIEILNTAPHGSTVGLTRIGDQFVPQFERCHEMPPEMMNSLILAQAAAVRCLRTGRQALASELAQFAHPEPLFSTLVTALSSTSWLNQFAHQAICRAMN